MGRIAHQPILVFGMVDAWFQPSSGYIEIVPQRDRDLLANIINAIHSATKILYTMYQLVSYTVNHTYNFLDPNTGVHTQVSYTKG